MIIKIGQWLNEIHDTLRLGKDKVFAPIVYILPDELTPNHITWTRIALTLGWLPVAIVNPALWQVFLFAFIYFLDLLDGAMARLRNRVTYRGAYLDHVSDKFGNIAVLIALFGVTGYRFDVFMFFIWWDMIAAVYLVLEGWAKNKTIAFARMPLELIVKTSLWIFLLFDVLPSLRFSF